MPKKIYGRRTLRMPVLSYKKRTTFNQKVKKILKGNIEKKYYPSGLALEAVISTAKFIRLTGVPQGVGDTKRDGDVIFPHGLEVKGSLQRAVGAAGKDEIRMIVFQWKDSDATAPTQAQIMSSTGTAPVFSLSQWDQKSRYNILYDRVFTLNSVGIENELMHFHIKIPGKKLLKKIEFQAASEDGANNVYMYLLGTNLAGANESQLNYHARMVFTE